MRWAKVPERLLDVLVAVPRDQRESVAPGTALAGYVALAVTANFQTGEVKCTPAQLAVRIDVTPRAARRTLALLERVGALAREDNRLWLRGEDADLQVPGTAGAVLKVRPADLRVPETDLQVRPTEPVHAGHGPDPANPSEQSFSQNTANASQEEEVQDVWGTLETLAAQQQLPVIERPPLPSWMHERDRVTGRIREVRALRAAARPPGRGARLQDVDGTPGGDAREVAGLGLDASGAEGSDAR